MRDPVPDQRVRFRPNPQAARNVRYANHGSEHITAFRKLVFCWAAAGRAFATQNSKKSGRLMAAPVFALLGAFLGG
jgi:hypothetical protein